MLRQIIAVFRLFVPALLMSVLAVAVASCSSSRSLTASARSESSVYTSTKKSDSARRSAGSFDSNRGGKKDSSGFDRPLAHIDFGKVKLDPISEKLLREADSWIGTTYLYGGNDRQGVDCSGLVVQVFKNSLGISLPRTSAQQQTYCDSIAREELFPGDLVFFSVRGGQNVGHVGIYIGDNKMIHSSSSRGVIISPLDLDYYVVNYYGSGRVGRYYAMCGDANRRTVPTNVAPPVKISSPVADPEPPIYASAQTKAEPVAQLPTILSVDETSPEEEPTVEELTEDEQAAVRARAALRVGRIGHFQQDSK